MLMSLLLAAAAAPVPVPVAVEFKREVVNLESFIGSLASAPPSGIAAPPELSGDLWYGAIARKPKDVPVVVEFRGGQVVRARADVNLNGNLSDDGDAKLSRYPGEKEGRSFLVPLKWDATREGKAETIERLVRVVVDPFGGGDRTYRTQDVHGMLGTLDVAGKSRLALLFDADRDGFYTKGGGDGVFVDLDGDKHFVIDVMTSAFGPFATTFTLGLDAVTVDEIDPAGTRLALRKVGPGSSFGEIIPGMRIPDVLFTGSDGKPVLLSAQRGKPLVIQFWSSGCETCRADADGLRDLYARYAPDRLGILGVSYDTDRKAMEAFRREHGHAWPSSFTGGVPSEDALGRLFQEKTSGIYYVIDAEGRLAFQSLDVVDLDEKLASLIRPARP